MALLAPLAIEACSRADAQPRPGPRPRPRATRAQDAGVPNDARADSGFASNGCPARLEGLQGTSCAHARTEHCYSGPEHCACVGDAGARQWRCETVFLGPLPPPDLAA